MSIQDMVLQVTALVCFGLGAAPIPTGGINLVSLGLFFVTLTVFV